MGKAFSQLASQQDEDKSLLPDNPARASKAANYFSRGGGKPPCSSVPYARVAGTSFVICPTCLGNGEIPRELEKQLVALIPYGDQRLKPRHTKLSVFLAVIICLLAFSLTIFFLYPRSIVVYPVGLNSSMVTFEETHIRLNMTNILNISNSNFYPVTVTKLTAEVLHQTSVVGQVTSSLRLHIGPLASEQMPYEVVSRIGDNSTYNICSWLKIKVHHVLLHIQGALTCSYLSHPQQLPFESFEYVDCRENISVPHLESPRPA
ncbi:transmembrane protein 106A [Peromyscus maniculatus bairdii]|uniref:Transmembrane protein 106A n=1 Tax=Peromyscus maniculatus bairdii TaxID=230844 RepID=A0A6J0CGY4_PERMB|nr:transmembrane protein 106A [Peromyscus maniculatus bairdii]